MNVRLHRDDGFQLVELLAVVVIVAVVLVAGLPVFLGNSDKAHDSNAKQTIGVAGKLGKLAYHENGQSYPDTGDLPTWLRREEGTDTYTYRTHFHYVSTSTGPTDVSLRSIDGHTLHACVLSRAGRTLCGVFRDPARADSGGVPGPGGVVSATGGEPLTFFVEPPSDRIIIPSGQGYATSQRMSYHKPTGAFEVGAWVMLGKKPSGGDSTIAAHGCTWSEGLNCRTEDSGWALAVDKDLRVHFTVYVQGLGWITEDWSQPSSCRAARNQAQRLSVDTWHYVSAHYDPSGTITAYVDGLRQECSGALGGRVAVINSVAPLYIGAQVNPAGQVPVAGILEGAIAELRMTQGNGPAHVPDPGPRPQPGRELPDPAENGRPATFLFHFNDKSDAAENLDDMILHGDAGLGY